MPSYFFLFGNTPQLSAMELQSLLPEVELILPNLAQVEFSDDDAADVIFNKLGGSVKAIRLVEKLDSKDHDFVLAKIAEFLSKQKQDHKLTFSLGVISGKKAVVTELDSDNEVEAPVSLELEISETQIKKYLKEVYKLPSRFIEHTSTGLSASVLLHQAVIEIILVEAGDNLYLGQTVLIQNIDDWTIRDRNKPYADRKKGMLPPKVARMMVNIAGGANVKTIYDPFCGTGTVLSEAMMVGHRVVGSDLDGRATAGAEKNLTWLAEKYDLKSNFKIFWADATQVSKAGYLKPGSVDAIVTEPFLGKPKPQLNQLDDIFKGLEKIYLGVFKAWSHLLTKGAKIAIVFPQVETHKKTYNLGKLIDKLAELGYTTTSEPVLYARKGAITARQIYVFEFNK